MPLRLGRTRIEREPRTGYRAVGRVERPRGLRGEIKVEPLTDFPERFAVGARLFLAGEARTVSQSRWHKGRVFLMIEGLTDVESADALRDELLEVPESERPGFAEHEFYVDEIEGCEIRTEDGRTLGTVSEVLKTGANDVFIVPRDGLGDLLIPAISDVVRKVRLKDRTIVVDLPPGLE